MGRRTNLVILAGLTLSAAAWAVPTPPDAKKDLIPLESGWPLISLYVDVRNLTGPGGTGTLPESKLASRIDEVNKIWSQCAIKFVVHSALNVSAEKLKIPYSPRSQDDLGKIAEALNPHGYHDAVPLTFAGPWNFYDSRSGLYLNGLGWVFTNNQGLDRIGAMVSATKIFIPAGGAIIAHELAHALSLPHVANPKNLMGPGGTEDLTEDQCKQARNFSEIALREFVVN